MTVRELAAADQSATEGIPVETTATVTYSDPEWRLLFVQDGGVGIYVEPPANLQVRPGDRVRISGETSASKGIAEATVDVLNHSDTLPDPVPVNEPADVETFASKWVKESGQVRWAGIKNGRAAMQVVSDGVKSFVYLANGNADHLPPMASEVTVTGVAAAQFNNGRVDGFQLMVPFERLVKVVNRGPAEPFALPVSDQAQIESVASGRLIHLSGDLTSLAGETTLAVGKLKIPVHLAAPALQGSYKADVAGFWAGDHVEDALVRAAAATVNVAGAIREISELKRLTTAQAAEHRPVAVRATVTYFDSDWGLLFVQEKNAAVYVDVHDQTLQLAPGDLVEVVGQTSPGDFAPSIVHALVTVLRHGKLPRAAEINPSREDPDAWDSRWCKLTGIVHAAHTDSGHTVMRVRVGDSDFMITVPQVLDGGALVDRHVTVTGALGVLFNDRKQAIGNQLFTPSEAFITSFSDHRRSDVVRNISSLQRYTPELDTRHSVMIQGVVVQKAGPDVAFVADSGGGIEVRGVAPLAVADGDVVKARGFVVPGEYSPVLEDSVVTVLAKGAMPAPTRITAERAMTGAFDAKFVSITGVVNNISRGAGNTTLNITAGGRSFAVTGPDASAVKALRLGSTVEVHGICHVYLDRFPVTIRGFMLTFDSPASIRVLRPGPWWTTPRIELGVLLLLALAGTVLAWAEVLRREIRSRTNALRSLLEAQTKAQKFDGARNAVLEAIAGNEPLPLTMQRLAVAVEEQIPGATCVIVIEQDQALLQHGSREQAIVATSSSTSEELRQALRELVEQEYATSLKDDATDQFVHRMLEAGIGAGGQFAAATMEKVDAGRGRRSGLIVVLLDKGRAPRLEGVEDMVLQSAARIVSLAQDHSLIHQRLLHDAYHDGLTGLPNRSLLEDRLEHARAICERKKQAFAVFCIDLDGFKQVNDSLGHTAGDELLRIIASRLNSRIRRADTIGRVGGDEFMAVVEDCAEPAVAAHVAESLLAALREPITIENTPVQVAGSIGIAMYPKDGKTPTELKRHADLAMYTAKMRGGNQVNFWSADQHASRSAETEALLRRSLEEKRFELLYQPIFDRTRRMIAIEALLRVRTPEGKLLSPADFIAVAEESGLIVPIGKWVLEECCRQMKRWAANVCVAVNVSARQFAMPDFSDMVAKVIQDSGVRADLLELELTETVVMSDVNGSRVQMERLKRLGVHIAVDDFGTGYSSLNYLHKLPIDILKIDRSFCRSIDAPGGSRVIVDAVVNIARTFGMTTVAEGVETPEQFDSVVHAGCDRFQGYLFAKPMSTAEMTAFIKAANVSEPELAGHRVRRAHVSAGNYE